MKNTNKKAFLGYDKNGKEAEKKMDVIAITKLPAFNSRCYAVETDKAIWVQSYDHLIAFVDKDKKTLNKRWGESSPMSTQHINALLTFCGLPKITGKQWESIKMNGSMKFAEA